MSELGATEHISRYVTGFDLRDANDAAIAAAENLLLDSFGVLVAAANSDLAGHLSALVVTGDGPGASVVGRAGRAAPAEAAFANGALAHLLEFDDSTLRPVGHPSCVVMPALLAVTESDRLGGADLLRGYLVGLEVHARLGEAQASPWSHKATWLPIGTISLVAAAAGCASALGLDRRATARCLGLAAHQAGQLGTANGTHAKSLGTGISARAAVVAALLARAGASAPECALERPGGFADTFLGAGHDLTTALGKLGGPMHIEQVGVAIKRFPSCYAAHWPADALLEILGRRTATAPPESIELVYPDAAAFVDRPDPVDVEDARFSMQWVMATAVVDGYPGLSGFTEQRLTDPTLRDVLSRIVAQPHPPGTPSPQCWQFVVSMVDSDGTIERSSVRHPVGHPRNPIDRAGIERKLRDCLAGSVADGRTSAFVEAVTALRAAGSVERVAALIRPGAINAPHDREEPI